jgi:hypothetical protein
MIDARYRIIAEGVIYACITVQAYLHYSYITATLRLYYGYIATTNIILGLIFNWFFFQNSNYKPLFKKKILNKIHGYNRFELLNQKVHRTKLTSKFLKIAQSRMLHFGAPIIIWRGSDIFISFRIVSGISEIFKNY